MSRWLIAQGDRQFAANDLAELKALAKSGEIRATDMVQPPGASDWLYASEIAELRGLLREGSSHDDDDDAPRRSGLAAPLIGVFLLIAAGGGGAAWYYGQKIPDYQELDLLSEEGLAMTEMLVTQDGAPLLDRPDGKPVGSLVKNAEVNLVAKRPGWYAVRTADSREGYIKVEHAVPGYYFADKRVQEDFDPLFNPDKYVFVKNSSWMQLSEQNRALTVFEFMLQNKSKFAMTDIVLLATISRDGQQLAEVEIPIEGRIPPYDAVMVGTLIPERANSDELPRRLTTFTFNEMLEQDEDLQLRWTSGVEVEMPMAARQDDNANIDIVELRAIPFKME